MAGFHQQFPVVENSQVGAARRAAVALAAEHGFDEVASGRVAIVVTELGNNLVRHAQGGCLLVAAAPAAAGSDVEIEILSVDDGPGIADVARVMVDGFSTGGTPGSGLGAARRLSEAAFDVFSVPGEGTVILARIGKAAARPQRALFEVGGVATPFPGEAVCGDAWRVVCDGPCAAVLVADGLGHGPDAAEASAVAVHAFARQPFRDARDLFQAMHREMRSTRGAAVAMVQLTVDHDVLFWGAGNIAGRLLNAVGDRSLISQSGTVGVQMRTLQEQRLAWPLHGVLVLHSDGLKTRWNLQDTPALVRHHPGVIAGWLWRQHRRGTDDACVVVVKRSEGS